MTIRLASFSKPLERSFSRSNHDRNNHVYTTSSTSKVSPVRQKSPVRRRDFAGSRSADFSQIETVCALLSGTGPLRGLPDTPPCGRPRYAAGGRAEGRRLEGEARSSTTNIGSPETKREGGIRAVLSKGCPEGHIPLRHPPPNAPHPTPVLREGCRGLRLARG